MMATIDARRAATNHRGRASGASFGAQAGLAVVALLLAGCADATGDFQERPEGLAVNAVEAARFDLNDVADPFLIELADRSRVLLHVDEGRQTFLAGPLPEASLLLLHPDDWHRGRSVAPCTQVVPVAAQYGAGDVETVVEPGRYVVAKLGLGGAHITINEGAPQGRYSSQGAGGAGFSSATSPMGLYASWWLEPMDQPALMAVAVHAERAAVEVTESTHVAMETPSACSGVARPAGDPQTASRVWWTTSDADGTAEASGIPGPVGSWFLLSFLQWETPADRQAHDTARRTEVPAIGISCDACLTAGRTVAMPH